MKKLLFVFGSFVLMCISITATASPLSNKPGLIKTSVNRDVPPAIVVTSFHAIFGNVAVRQWKERSNGQWRAHFLRNGIPWEATFTSTGILVKSERD